MLIVNFWKNKQSGNYFSHKQGLTSEMAEELRNVKEGDRLVIWVQDKKTDNHPELSLKVYKNNNREEL
jgi:hypothetical protein